MKKQTTRQRVEQAVEKVSSDSWSGGASAVSVNDTIKLILAERRRIRREVGKLKKDCPHMVPEEHLLWQGWMEACDDILARLRG